MDFIGWDGMSIALIALGVLAILVVFAGDRFIGKETVLSEPIRNGSGSVALDDSVWRIAGPDLAAGQRIRIIGHDGAVLKVEAA